MNQRLFVGNLSFETTEADLNQLFSKSGTCTSATVVIDRLTGRSRGFGFVEMSSDEEAQRAVSELNDIELQGRKISVSAARERPKRQMGQGSWGHRDSGFRHGGGGGGGGGGPGPGFGKTKGSRRGLRRKKRSL